MTRIRQVPLDEARGDVARFYEATAAMLGRVPHSYQVLGNVPFVAKFLLPFSAVLQRQGAGSLLSSKIKEMVIIKTSHLNGCEY